MSTSTTKERRLSLDLALTPTSTPWGMTLYRQLNWKNSEGQS